MEIILSDDWGGIPSTYCQLTGCSSQLAFGRSSGFCRVFSFKQQKWILTDLVAKKVGSSQNHYEGWETQTQSCLAKKIKNKKLCCRNSPCEKTAITDTAPFLHHQHCAGKLIWPQLHCCQRENCLLPLLLCISGSLPKTLQELLLCQDRSWSWIQAAREEDQRRMVRCFTTSISI